MQQLVARVLWPKDTLHKPEMPQKGAAEMLVVDLQERTTNKEPQ